MTKSWVLTAAVALIAASPLAAQERETANPRTDQTVPVSRGSRLSLNNHAGEVIVRTWEKDALRVQARHSTRTRINIRTVESAVSVRASSNGPTGSVDYEITAPAWMPVKVEGPYLYILVEGAQGEVSAETTQGDIVIRGGSGLVTAKSIQGEVVVEGARGKISASSVNQAVKISGAVGDVTAETTNGSISMTNVNPRSVTVDTVNGNISYEGSLADGGHYMFTTHNGNITMALPDNSNATFTVRTYHGEAQIGLAAKRTEEPHRGKRTVYVAGTGSAQVELESFGGRIRIRRAVPGGGKE